MDLNNRPKVLCVDDEPKIVEALALHLRRRFEPLTATSGPAGLELLQKERDIAVVVSDMRMPGMDGAAFLSQARLVAPDATRVLLTGQADLDAVIEVINEGQIFRFLVKPCPPAGVLAAVGAAVEQHRLVISERVLLEETLHGSIKALTDVLALTNPAAFGRVAQIKQHAGDIATKMGLAEKWQIEVAAMLSQIGLITLPPETVQRLNGGVALSREEQAMVDRLPQVAEKLLANIPRLEVVRALLAEQAKPFRKGATVPDVPRKRAIYRGGEVLRAARDLAALEALGESTARAADRLRRMPGFYDPDVLEALSGLRGMGQALGEPQEMALASLAPGMILAEDVRLENGALLVTRGYEVTEGFIERIGNFRRGAVREPVKVLLPDYLTPAAEA